MLVEITINSDGSFRVETTSLHYAAASFGEAVGWFAQQLLYEQERAKAEGEIAALGLAEALGIGEAE